MSNVHSLADCGGMEVARRWGGRLPDRLSPDGAGVMVAGYVAVVGVRVMENLQARSVISYTCQRPLLAKRQSNMAVHNYVLWSVHGMRN